MTYICSYTGKECEGEPWMTLSILRWDNLPGPVTFSSYLSYIYSMHKIPKYHYEFVENKEDFNYLFPIIDKQDQSKVYPMLTETEINELSDEQYQRYKESINTDLWDMYNEEQINELYDMEYISDLSTSDEDECDDY